ncbi:MAG TPA: amidohydrolase family protein [Gaiellaceae bacterium]|jgi:imidazolonepropionase-like amidohydrolase|nr:amidohydrolase family protein [Gaiellaceae bacterium]
MSPTLLENCSVVDVHAGQSLPDGVVLIDGDRIAAVGPRAEVELPGTAERVDLGGAHVLPGLINCHVHFGLVLPGTEGDRLRNESDAALALRMAANAAQTLGAGVTTVRLVGERPYADIALRDSIAAGETAGPRILTAGPLLISTGGHGWELGSCVEADGPDGFRAAARTQIKHGTDLVKISVSGGIAGENEAIADSQMTPAEIAAVTETAHARGKHVAAHAGPPGVIRTAVECGVNTIEHGYFLTGEVAAVMHEHGSWLVPTINVSRAVAFYEKIGAPHWMVEKALAAGELHWAGLREAINRGVRIAMGTDMIPHEPFDGTSVTVRELEFYVEAGMTPPAALRSATIDAAELLGRPELGRLEPGVAADLIAVRGDPIQDIASLRQLELVVSRGRVVA